MPNLSYDLPQVAIAVRTLLLSGYVIETNRRQPTHTELHCHSFVLGSPVKLLIAMTEDKEFSPIVLSQIREAAKRDGQSGEGGWAGSGIRAAAGGIARR